MSDDTPTQRFPSPDDGSNVPTQRIDTAGTELVEEKEKSRGLLIGLIIAGALLVIAIVVLVVFLIGRGSGDPVVAGDTNSPTPDTSPSASATPSDTPSATPTPEPTQTQDAPPPPPADDHASFSIFSPTTTVHCEFAAPNFTPPPIAIQITYRGVKTAQAWFVQGTDDAANSGFMQIPISGDETDFPYEIDFPCYQTSATYTITLVGKDGGHVSKSWTVKNTGDHN